MKKLFLTFVVVLTLTGFDALAKVVFLPEADTTQSGQAPKTGEIRTVAPINSHTGEQRCKDLGYKTTSCTSGALINQCPYNPKFYKTCGR